MKRVILWFRRDLRLQHNPAFDWAVRQRAQVMPVYIHSPDEETPWQPGGASRWWLHHSLRQLQEHLAGIGLKLHFYRGGSAEILLRLVGTGRVDAVSVNRLYEPGPAQHDLLIAEGLADHGAQLRQFDSALLISPDEILNAQGKPYRVFTPFWRKTRRRLLNSPPATVAQRPAVPPDAFELKGAECCTLDQIGLLDGYPWSDKLHRYWQPGEQAALARLDEFVEFSLPAYEIRRDFPATGGTSRLSPHLHFGEITPAQIYLTMLPLLDRADQASGKSIERLLAELGWREFAHYVLWHFPHSCEHSMNPRFDESFWREDSAALHAWCLGETGVPLVDAGMHELWETGWMHNRARMVAASFLTKNLGIHWLHGARWFWDTLVDADLASNSLGWQWVAGTGVDAAPYYRVFNPRRQAERFDPQNEYLQRWQADRTAAPIVDLSRSREQALQRYQELAAQKPAG